LQTGYSVQSNRAPTAPSPNSAHNFTSRAAAGSDKLYRVIAALSDQEQSMAIDFSTVNWLYVAIMAVFAFVASLLGGLISFRNRIGGALLAAILFAAMYVVWNYYPHPQIQLPIVSAYSTPSGG
jgi:lipopolysaccharide export LptBFGC system permease protein LptF